MTEPTPEELDRIAAEVVAKIRPPETLMNWERHTLLAFARAWQERMEQWRPIATAPKDGQMILLLSKPDKIPDGRDGFVERTARAHMGSWDPSGDSWVSEDGKFADDEDGASFDQLKTTGTWSSGGGWFQPNEVTHWMPLPAPPTALADALERLQDRVDEIEQFWKLVNHDYDPIFPDRPFDAGPPEQRAAMLVSWLVEQHKADAARIADLERDLLSAVKQRDRAELAADKLAEIVAPDNVRGEHSNLNCPWSNAIEFGTDRIEKRLAEAEVKPPFAPPPPDGKLTA